MFEHEKSEGPSEDRPSPMTDRCSTKCLGIGEDAGRDLDGLAHTLADNAFFSGDLMVLQDNIKRRRDHHEVARSTLLRIG